jgi:hypothetical protein
MTAVVHGDVLKGASWSSGKSSSTCMCLGFAWYDAFGSHTYLAKRAQSCIFLSLSCSSVCFSGHAASRQLLASGKTFITAYASRTAYLFIEVCACGEVS